MSLFKGAVSALAATGTYKQPQVKGTSAHLARYEPAVTRSPIQGGGGQTSTGGFALPNTAHVPGMQTLQNTNSAQTVIVQNTQRSSTANAPTVTEASDPLLRRGRKPKKKKTKDPQGAESATCTQPTNGTQAIEGSPCPTSTYSGGVRHTGPRYAAHFVGAAAGALGGGLMRRR